MGAAPGDTEEIVLLNRIIRWVTGADGAPAIEVETDARHSQIMVEQLGLAKGNTKTCSTPGVKKSVAGAAAPSEELGEQQAKMFKSITMRANFLAIDGDRTDLFFMLQAWEDLKRLGRYVLGKPRMVQVMRHQRWPGRLATQIDSDFAGCAVTGRSSTGLALFHGEHLIKAASTTQTVVALSSGEAEFNAIVRGTAFVLVTKSLAKDYGVGVLECHRGSELAE
eukprot:6469493-Amphidinium_carterae.2